MSFGKTQFVFRHLEHSGTERTVTPRNHCVKLRMKNLLNYGKYERYALDETKRFARHVPVFVYVFTFSSKVSAHVVVMKNNTGLKCL